MAAVRAGALLPFPLRVNPFPYRIEYGGVEWTLFLERVQRKAPDERIATVGTNNVDLRVDREGQLSYSRVVGHAEAELDKDEAFRSFLDALNVLIAHVRDVFSEFWIRTVALEDLYQPFVEVGDSVTAIYTVGRGGAFTLAVVGRTEDGEKRLQKALASRQRPPVWRDIQLDARDALLLGRNEDSVVLGWTALESACRQALPGLAFATGLSIDELADRLVVRERRKYPPFSYQEAVQRQSGGLKIVEVASELMEPRIYDPGSVRSSVELVYRLRNRIVHQGVRVRRDSAQQALEAIDFVLNNALTLRSVAPPPATHSWQRRFGRVLPEVDEFVSSTGLRLVVARPENGSHFEMERIVDELWVRFSDDFRQRLAAILVLTEWETWRRQALRDRPFFRLGPPSGITLEGTLARVMWAIQAAVSTCEALALCLRNGIASCDRASDAVRRIINQLAQMPTLDPNDARIQVQAAWIAAYLATLPNRGHAQRLRRLKYQQPEVWRLAQRWTQSLAAIDPDEPHSRCAAMRTIHADCIWLDSILVECPIEGVAYGSRRWPTDQAPGR